MSDSTIMNPSIGKPLARVDGFAKVTGGARYAAEFNQPRQAYAVVVGAGVGLGRISRIEAAAVGRMPGVLAVISHLNAPRLAYQPHKGAIDPAFGERLHVLQDDQVRFYGQPVAVIVAQTLDQAEHAAAALHITYESRTPMVRAEDIQPMPPQAGLRPGGISADNERGHADAAFAAAAVKVDASYTIARENHNPMEPHATVAAWSGDRLTLWSKSQFVVNEAAEIAAVFGLPAQNVQVVCPFIGGAFGTSLRTWPHVTLAALAAKQTGRPVKLVLSRRQMFHTTGHRPRTTQRVALGAGADGTTERDHPRGHRRNFALRGVRRSAYISVELPLLLSRCANALPACTTGHRHVHLYARSGRGERHLCSRDRDGRAGGRAEDGSDRAALAQRAVGRRRQWPAVLEPFAARMLPARCGAFRVGPPRRRGRARCATAGC